MSPTERIAQTFPDIASQGLNTSGTAAGVRSFPQPFIGVTSGVEILIQNAMLTIPSPGLSATATLGTTVDITKSLIIYRGVNVNGFTDANVSCHRTRMDFRNIVADMSFEVRARRSSDFVPPASTCPTVDVYFTVVTFTGANTDSADIRIERCFTSIIHPATTGSCILPGAQLTPAELVKSFVFIRGIEFARFPQTLGDSCSSGGVGLNCWKRPEQQRTTVELKNVGPNTVVEAVRFTAGDVSGFPDCGESDIDVYFTAVIFP